MSSMELARPPGVFSSDDEALVVLIGGEVERAGDVIGRGRADGAVDLDQPDLARREVSRRKKEMRWKANVS